MEVGGAPMGRPIPAGITAFGCLLFFLIPFPAFAGLLDIAGTVSQRYKFRTTGSLEDHDLETVLTANAGNRSDRLAAFLNVGGRFDLNRPSSAPTYSSVYDSFDNQAVVRLYSAYLDLKDAGPVALWRTGCQHRFDFEL